MPLRFALDQNFPTPIVDCLAQYIVGVDLSSLHQIDPRLCDLDDRPLLIALRQLGFDGLVTNNYRMFDVPSEVAAILATKLTVFGVEGVGDDPLRATGAVLLDLPGALTQFKPDEPQIFWVNPRNPRPVKPWDRIGVAASRRGVSAKELYQGVKVSEEELETPVMG
jgi:hypothetical protein